MMNKKITVISFVLIGFLLAGGNVFAQTVTPTPGNIRDAVQQKVQEELSSIRQAVAKKGFIGSITAKTESDLTVTNLKSQTRMVTVAPDATIKLVDNKEGTVANLKVNDFILVMGDVDSQNKMIGKRILVLKQPQADTRASQFVTVTKTASGSLTVENSKKETWTVKTSSSTSYTMVTEGKIAKSKAADVKTGAKLIVVGPATAANSLTATNIHLLSQ